MIALVFALAAAAEPGFVSLFDGKTLDGWKLVRGRGPGYVVENGAIVCPANGGGNLFTAKEYSDFILRYEYRMEPGGNNGLGIRAPLEGDAAYAGMEIQILDDQHEKYKGRLKPEQHTASIYDLFPARSGFQRPAGEWNEEEVIARGRRIQIKLNGVIVIDANLDNVKEEAKLKRHPGLQRAAGHIGFLGHGTRVEFRNIRIRELKGGESGFVPLFDGKTLSGWRVLRSRGPGYVVEEGAIVCPAAGGGILVTEREYSNFVMRYEYRIYEAGNNGLGLRLPAEFKRPAFDGMEIQILDDRHEKWRGRLKPEQFTGSVYDVFPARSGFQKAAGEWNESEVALDGNRIQVAINGAVVLKAVLDEVDAATLKKNPGLLRKSGFIGFLGHGDRAEFRNIRVKELE